MIHILFSTARSGSTWYGSVLSKKYMALFLNEVFHDELKPYHKQTFRDIYLNYTNNEQHCVIKIFPNHFFKSTIPNLKESLLDLAATKEILVRRSFNDQAKSLYVAYEYELQKNPENLTSIPHTWQENFDTPLVINTINYEKLKTIVRRLETEFLFLSELHREYNIKVTYFEDVKDNFKDLNLRIGKLHRPVIWNETFPNLNVDTESLFK